VKRASLFVGAVLALVGCDVTWGDLPVKCAATGECPEGYDCIQGVCAATGTLVPSTVTTTDFLRPTDARLVALDDGVLVAWESYAYSDVGQKFLGATVDADGAVGAEFDLVSTFAADQGALEPYFDVVRGAGDTLLLAVSASPLPDDSDPSPRLLTYRVDFGSGSFQAAWPQEKRLGTIGYGAVSEPRFAPSATGFELGYVQSGTTLDGMGNPQTIAELVRFDLGVDGTELGPLPALPARTLPGLPLSVGVLGAFDTTDARGWVLDRDRPSLVRVFSDGTSDEVKLARFASAGVGDGDGFVYVEPSERDGEKLPTDPASAPASLRRVAADGTDAVLGELPVLRDTPAPVYLARSGSTDVVVSIGGLVDGPTIQVFTVDRATGASTEAAAIERFGTGSVSTVLAAIVAGRLYVVWVEENDAAYFIRASVLPEP